MAKRKLDCVIKESLQINNKSKLSDDDVKYRELYSDKNIKLILFHHFQDKVIDINIYEYVVNKEKEELCNKHQKDLIKKLKFDLYLLKSSELREKIHIFSQKDDGVILAASIIRFFKQGVKNAMQVIPVINLKYSLEIINQIEEVKTFDNVRLCMSVHNGSELLIKNKKINISKFIEIIKVEISNINNQSETDYSIRSIIQESSNIYKTAHQRIVDDKLKDNVNCSSDEEEKLVKMKDTIKHEEIICKELKQVVTGAVKKKHLTWDLSVNDNEGRTYNNKEVKLYDREAINIFAKAVEKWDLELFKKAKEKSNDFVKLIDYFYNEIRYKFWLHFYNNDYYQDCFRREQNNDKLLSLQIEHNNFIEWISDGYVFLVSNFPIIWDKLKKEQLNKRHLSKSDKIAKDLIAIMEEKMSPQQDHQNDYSASNNVCTQ